MITYSDIARALPAGAASRPILEAMYTRNEWLLKPMLAFLEEGMLGAYVERAEEIWRVMRAVSDLPEEQRVAQAIKGLQFHSMEFLKLQIEFAKGGGQTYKAKSYDDVYKAVYSSGDVMQQYLDGLLLTYIAWPNHYRLLHWYAGTYCAKSPPGRCLEIGPGHGWLALEQLRSNARNTLLGLDISPHSVRYTNAVLKAWPFEASRFRVVEADAQKELAGLGERFDRIVVAEVIEHLADPGAMLRSLRPYAHKDTAYCITTVINIEAPDHLYLFRSLKEVRAFLADAGLRIVDELDLELKINLPGSGEMYETAYMCVHG